MKPGYLLKKLQLGDSILQYVNGKARLKEGNAYHQPDRVCR
jgi:hypothetical protein